MITIFKRELKAHLLNIRGAVFIALTVATMGTFVYLSNFLNTNPQVEFGLKGSLIAFILTVPFLCMFFFTENELCSIKHMMSMSAKLHNIIFGRFLAAVCILAIPTVILCFVPVLLSTFGYVNFIESYVSILAYFLIGVCSISICMLISALAKSPVAAFLSGALVLALLFAGPTLSVYLPTSPVASLIAILVLELLLCAVLWGVTKKMLFGGVTLALAAIPTLICFFALKSNFGSLFVRAAAFISPFSRFDTFAVGIFRLEDIAYLLSLTAVLLTFVYASVRATLTHSSAFTAQKPTKQAFGLARYAYIALIAAFVLNIGVSFLPATVKTLDASGLNTYTIPEKADKLFSAIDDDITIYYLCEGNVVDVSVETVAKAYASKSKHIKYEMINTAQEPEFLSKYTHSGANNHSLIVASDKRFALIDSSEYYHYRVSGVSYTELEFNAYMKSIASEGILLTANEYQSFFDLDRKLTGAIEYVTSSKVNTVFTLTGHGERPVSEDFYNYIGVPCEYLDISETESVPEHCSTLIICSPERDITEADAKKIIDFYEAGGDIILITSPSNTRMENLMSIAKNCGLAAEHGTIIEKDEKMYYGDKATNLVAISNTSHTLVSYIMSQSEDYENPIFPNAHPISKLTSTSTAVKITDMFASSNDIMLQDGDSTSLRSRTAVVGVSVQEELENEKTANLIWFSSYDAFTEEWVDIRPTNMTYLLASASSIGATSEFVPTISIDSKNISGNLLKIQVHEPYIWGSVLAIIIPLIILGTGIFVYCIRRSKKN